MIKNRRNFALMAALGAALSSGAGAALAAPRARRRARVPQ